MSTKDRCAQAGASCDAAAAAERIKQDRSQQIIGAAWVLPAHHWKGTDMTRTAKFLHLAALTAAAAAFVAMTTQASAGSPQNCGPREIMVTRLAEGYGETRQSVGIGSDNAMVEVFASDKTGSWSIVVTMPAGVSCLVASGQSFEEVAEALPALGNDA